MEPLEVRGRRVVLMGLGRFGGGVGAARHLAQRGADLLVTDTADANALCDSMAQLADLPEITYRLGEHRESDFTHADLIVANPAVKPDNPYLRAARDAGVPVTSEMRMLVERLPDRRRVIGVTGTAGKSTVTAMIGHILRHTLGEQRVHVGGNLGGSLLGRAEAIGLEDWIVLELSSFMLDGLREDRWSPHVAVITNLAPNHLDWHGSFEAYALAKQAILDFQRDDDGDVAIGGPGVDKAYHAIDHVKRFDARERNAWLVNAPFDLLIPGEHNQLNARLAAEAVAAALGGEAAQHGRYLADFSGLPHRLQLVAEHAGVRYFNDAKATTPEAAMLALEAFEPGRAHVILGGSDKGSDLTPLAERAAARCRGVYTIGQVGERIASAAEAAVPSEAEIVRCGDLAAAMRAIVQRVRRGDAVVLSPGCASYDQFANYEQRGERFVEAVLRHTSETGVAPGG